MGLLAQIAQRHDATPAQVALAWRGFPEACGRCTLPRWGTDRARGYVDANGQPRAVEVGEVSDPVRVDQQILVEVRRHRQNATQ